MELIHRELEAQLKLVARPESWTFKARNAPLSLSDSEKIVN